MNRVIRQVFGTSRPRDIWLDLLTFDRLITKPVVHIVYWFGLGILTIVGCAWVGIMIGTGLKDASVMGWLLSFGLSVLGLLGVLLTVLVWRSFCEFYMAIMNIADDLRHLRQYQEKLDLPAVPAAEPTITEQMAEVAQKSDNILDEPLTRVRFERTER